jgi:hypothetical protein
MPRSLLVHLVLAATLISACSIDAVGSGSLPAASVAAPRPSAAPQRIPLPSGFPEPPGASPIALPSNDPGLIGLWTIEGAGSAAYDFFLRALPAAGFPIADAAAGDVVAEFRFKVPGGATLQIDIYATPNLTTRIEVRLPRP